MIHEDKQILGNIGKLLLCGFAVMALLIVMSALIG